MSATSPPNAQVYVSTYGSHSDDASNPVISQRDPNALDIHYALGKRWINTLTNKTFVLTKFEYNYLEKSALWTFGTGFQIDSAREVGPITDSYLVIDPACKPTSVIIASAQNKVGTLSPLTIPSLQQEDGNFRIVSVSPGNLSTVFYMIIN